NVVGRDFALVVGVPHEREAAFVSWVGLRVGRLEGRAARVRVRGSWCGAVRREGAQSCSRSQIGRAAIPSASRENVGTWHCSWAAACDITERGNLQRLVVLLAPLVTVNRGGWRRRTAVHGVVAIGIRNAGLHGEGA